MAMEPAKAPGIDEATDSPRKEPAMHAILLWVLGIPIPIIILLYLLGVFG
jgi:hypothetical protein